MLELKTLGSPKECHIFGEIDFSLRVKLPLLDQKTAKTGVLEPCSLRRGVGRAVLHCRCDRLC